MEFKLYFQIEDKLVLPISYHHILQGFIYKRLSEYPEFSDFLHNKGFQTEGQSFKLFVFSLLKGHFQVSGSKIMFDNVIEWEIRSPVPFFCEVLAQALENEEVFELAGQRIFLIRYEVTNTKILDEELEIRMLSPVCVDIAYREGEKTKTNYLEPTDPYFNYYLTKNFQRKFQAVVGKKNSTGIFLLPHKDFNVARNKYVTKFGGEIFITAWKGSFTLKSDIESLQFLYDTGLGSRNSQGFGMFEQI